MEETKLWFIGIDSLYLTIVGADLSGWYHVYNNELPEDVTFKQLKEGVPNAKFGYMLRSGAHGYKLSLWDGDMRMYFSPDKRMGIWVQFGPKWLRKWELRYRETGISLYDAVIQALTRYVGDLSDCEIRLNRLDWAADIEHDLAGMTSDEWAKGWVGFAGFFREYHSEEPVELEVEDGEAEAANEQVGLQPSAVNAVYKSRELETVYVGRPKSNVKFRAYDKIKQAIKDGDIDWWREVWASRQGGKALPPDVKITRLEWETRPYRAGFEGFTHLQDVTWDRLKALQAYLFTWGRLTVDDGSQNRSRWPLHRFWAAAWTVVITELEGLGKELIRHPIAASKRITDQYVAQAVGILTGAMARVALQGKVAFSLRNLSLFFEEYDYGPKKIMALAARKYQRYRIEWAGSGAI